MGGKVVSVTTDGFITNLPGLEERLMKLSHDEIPLLTLYRELRHELSEISDSLEIKHSGKGIISWTTRGQMGIESGIKATTGFQSAGYTKDELVKILKDTLKGKNKDFEYTRTSLRSAKDIFKKGGHVTPKLSDQKFRLLYDNRRQIQEPEGFTGFDLSNVLLDSTPLQSSLVCKQMRYMSKMTYILPYNKNTSRRRVSVYKSYLEVGVRNFIKGYLSSEPCFGLLGHEFKFMKHLISFINGFESTKDLKISLTSISNLKHRRIIIKPVPQTKENKAFAQYVKSRLPHFDVSSFLKNSP